MPKQLRTLNEPKPNYVVLSKFENGRLAKFGWEKGFGAVAGGGGVGVGEDFSTSPLFSFCMKWKINEKYHRHKTALKI